MNTPAVNTNIDAPEWSVVGVPCEGADQHIDRIHVYQNGALVVDAVSDEPTHAALSELTRIANERAAINALHAELMNTANRIVMLADAQYLRANGDGGRSAHAIEKLRACIEANKAALSKAI